MAAIKPETPTLEHHNKTVLSRLEYLVQLEDIRSKLCSLNELEFAASLGPLVEAGHLSDAFDVVANRSLQIITPPQAAVVSSSSTLANRR
jgi:hypothetical protein